MENKLKERIALSETLFSEYTNTFLVSNTRKDRDKVLIIKGKLEAYREMLKTIK